jgi:hypothetical protein
MIKGSRGSKGSSGSKGSNRSSGSSGSSGSRAARVFRVAAAVVLVVGLSTAVFAQARGATPRRTPAPAPRAAAKPPEPKVEPAALTCPSPLGVGVQTKQSFCDVLIGRDPLSGIIVTLPPHSGPVTLTFDLHNRHTYSEELVKSGRGFRRYTASIGVLAMDNTLLSRALIQSEFRTVADLFDRISGSGPSGLKAVAPTGTEPITIVIDAEEEKVSILGEKLTELAPDAPAVEFMATGRPIAIISNVMVRYQPAPARRPAAPTRRR